MDQLKGSEANAIEARCFEGETTLAYGLFVEALRSAAASPSFAQRLAAVPDRWLTEAGRLLPDLLASRTHLQPAPPLDHPGAQIQFFEGIYQTLLALSKDEQARLPSIFFLDNLQWADEASLDVLAYLVRRLRGRPVLLPGDVAQRGQRRLPSPAPDCPGGRACRPWSRAYAPAPQPGQRADAGGYSDAGAG